MCTLKLAGHRVKLQHPTRPRHHRRAPHPYATVGLIAKCDQATQASLSGIVSELLRKKTRHRKAKTRTVRVASVRATLPAGVARTLQVRLTWSLLLALEHRIREWGTFTLTVGTSRVTARGALRLR
jgi:hypothetical protein